ncbi:uncharacterized protein CLUP02_04670 [Colletotrichum lupini]|uniref:Uncharacterized protein n=1 Tax=Colletotrichum lupini TaxID=145971 RepID=A0A9Q8WDI6_9PEZI|nr:uncharacterized protein CLUP02_04670 [Colletotrichum lupini]UQC79191.1 hypothetical protein CLUP02_04670 [Colletotrichum lupini]
MNLSLICPSFALGSHIIVYEQTNGSSPLIESKPEGKKENSSPSRDDTASLSTLLCTIPTQPLRLYRPLAPTTAVCAASRRRDLATPNGSQNTPEPLDVFVSPPLASVTMPSPFPFRKRTSDPVSSHLSIVATPSFLSILRIRVKFGGDRHHQSDPKACPVFGLATFQLRCLLAAMDVSKLEHIVRSYGIAIDRHTLQAALDDPEHGTAFTEWARLHLGPENLLYVPMANQYGVGRYTALDRSGQIDKLVESQDLAAVQAVSEREIQTAIEELNRSTAAIVKQTETLKQQQDALSKLVKTHSRVEEARSDLVFQRNQKHDAESRKMMTTVEELSQSLEYKASDLEQQTKVSGNGLQQTLDSLLHSDDKLLSSLRKLGLELETEDPEDHAWRRLIKYTVETVRTKLDRLYLEALSSAHQNGVTSHPSDDVKTSQEELESLYAEILPVAQMSVEQQHLEPALKSLSSKNGQSLRRSAAAVIYIDECLDYLLDHMDRLSTRIEAYQSHKTATSSLLTTARAELSAPVATPKKKTPTQDLVSPVRRRNNTNPGRSPTRDAASNRRRRSSAFDEPPLETLLRSLAIAFPEDVTDGAGQTAVLAATLAERQTKARDVARNAQETLEGTAATQLADSKLAIQLLRDSLLAESPFGHVRLVDEGIEASIAVLGQEVEKVKERVEKVDAGKASVIVGYIEMGHPNGLLHQSLQPRDDTVSTQHAGMSLSLELGPGAGTESWQLKQSAISICRRILGTDSMFPFRPSQFDSTPRRKCQDRELGD